MFNKILIAYDGSENAKKALGVGVDLAKKYAARLDALSVVHLPDYGATVGEVEEAKNEGREHYEKLLAEAKEMAAKIGGQLNTEILFGHPADVIINYLSKGNYDLVIIGPRGISNIQKFLLGSVSNKVIHHAPCKVMLVK